MNFIPVFQIESRPRTAPFQHGQLLSQHEVFKDEIPAVAEDSKERPEREPQHAEHNRSYNRILAAAPGYLIGFKVGQSCGEPQRKVLSGENCSERVGFGRDSAGGLDAKAVSAR